MTLALATTTNMLRLMHTTFFSGLMRAKRYSHLGSIVLIISGCVENKTDGMALFDSVSQGDQQDCPWAVHERFGDLIRAAKFSHSRTLV